jgi:diadenosine tetraphosphatase ApaH/serine/threonine PP2A family protein phosphatase
MAPQTRDWLSALPLRSVDEPFTLVHGSPRDPTWEYVYSASIARANLNAFGTRHCMVGHTHVPLVLRQRGARIEGIRVTDGQSLALGEERLIVNPGSVGQPRDGDPRASAMILDTDTLTLEWRRVEYPVAQVQRLMLQANLPQRLITRLEFGL